jgi:hypothetical protein
MDIIKKKSLIVSVFIFILFGTAFIQYKNTLPEKKITAPSLIQVKQIIALDGREAPLPVRISVGTTALQLLRTTHKISTQGEKENAYVTAIDGKEALSTQKEFWAFYVNGKQAAVGAGSYHVKNNDTIEWKIETY